MKFTMRNTHESKRTGQAAKSKFFGVLKEKKNIRLVLEDDIKLLEAKREEVEANLNRNREKARALKNPDNFQ